MTDLGAVTILLLGPLVLTACGSAPAPASGAPPSQSAGTTASVASTAASGPAASASASVAASSAPEAPKPAGSDKKTLTKGDLNGATIVVITNAAKPYDALVVRLTEVLGPSHEVAAADPPKNASAKTMWFGSDPTGCYALTVTRDAKDKNAFEMPKADAARCK